MTETTFSEDIIAAYFAAQIGVVIESSREFTTAEIAQACGLKPKNTNYALIWLAKCGRIVIHALPGVKGRFNTFKWSIPVCDCVIPSGDRGEQCRRTAKCDPLTCTHLKSVTAVHNRAILQAKNRPKKVLINRR